MKKINITPLKSSDCVVLIPTYKTIFEPIELYCLQRTIAILKRFDIIFLIPENVDIGCLEDFPVSVCRIDSRHFGRTDRYNRWLLSREFYIRFLMYEKILICHADATVLRDDMDYWIGKDYHYIGAPWFNSLVFRPNFISRPELNGESFILNVGNGGFSMRNPRKFIEIIDRYINIIKEFCLNTGANCNEDGLFAYIGQIDSRFKVAPHDEAVRFALELNSRNQMDSTGVLPMGFHAMYKYDPELWMRIFPDSPQI
jgi:hypothetical protein